MEKNNMLISHEVPLDLLDSSLMFNDYDYLLPHYYVKYPKYKEFYLKSRENGRFIIMDNGLFEGGGFTNTQLIEIIKEVQPDIFIVPDEWNDYKKTLNNSRAWMNMSGLLPSGVKLMVVLQGMNYHEIETMYDVCDHEGYTHFGFNHSSMAYDEIHSSLNPLISKMMGRIKTLDRLENNRLLDKTNYHHLLGVNLPQELQLISKNYINSVDTSNPVIAGIKGLRYNNLGLETKPKEKIEEFMEKDLSPNIEDIIFNINKFKQFVNG